MTFCLIIRKVFHLNVCNSTAVFSTFHLNSRSSWKLLLVWQPHKNCLLETYGHSFPTLLIRQSRMCSPCYADKMWRKNRPIICNSPHRLIRSVPLLNPLHTLKYTLWAFVLLLFTAAKCQLVPELDLLTLPKYKGQHLEAMRYFHQANELLGTVLNFFFAQFKCDTDVVWCWWSLTGH